MGHSTGGSIATVYLERHAEDKEFRKAILSSPMFQMRIPPGGYELVSLASFTGLGTQYAAGNGPARWLAPFDGENKLTHSRARFEIADKVASRLASAGHRRIEGATNQWVREAYEMTSEARKNADKITTPIVILQGGGDEVVDVRGHETVCDRVAPNCTLVRFPGAYHELPAEEDRVRNAFMGEVKKVLADR